MTGCGGLAVPHAIRVHSPPCPLRSPSPPLPAPSAPPSDLARGTGAPPPAYLLCPSPADPLAPCDVGLARAVGLPLAWYCVWQAAYLLLTEVALVRGERMALLDCCLLE